ncbi:two-component system sensor histidine kinase NtrB [Marinimicrococcus flavescens]|uniref:histidine kinase n=1 Tax=Marinimicrococcus flavescens TaxID=3031815 RepID=A0AAP4D660_9PROT|nr:ATP-binding protein [Marinimicrococcus flavescens]
MQPAAELLLANLPSAVLHLDATHRLCYVNPAAEQLFSAGRRTLQGRTLEELLAPHATLVGLVAQVQESGSSISDYAVELALARGDVLQVDCHLAPVAETPGAVLLVLQPCSVARRLDAHLAQRGTARSVAALAATLAHEVKNPLSGIRGAAQLLEPCVEDPEDRALARLICDEADRIVGLIDRMEEFAEGGAIRRQSVNIHQVLEHVRRIAENGFARHHRIVELYDPSLPEVEGDRDRLIQLFLNLVKNAAEAAPAKGGVLTLATQYQHGLRVSLPSTRQRLELPITVEVRDNGPGVRDGLLEDLFEPFVTTKARGSGLGLPLAAKITGDHGGMIAYAPGDPGAIFRVRLPAAGRSARQGGSEGR